MITLHKGFVKSFLEGEKDIELRTRVPKALRPGDIVLVAQSGTHNKVVLQMSVLSVIKLSPSEMFDRYYKGIQLNYLAYEDYTKGRNGQLKDNWSTPRRRMQMMWARAVSDGVRTVCPLATRGHYTPEEAVDFDEPKVVNVTPVPASYPQQEAGQPAAPAPDPAPAPAMAPAAPVVEVLPPQEPPTVPPAATQPTAPAATPAMFKNDGPADLDYTVCKIDGPMKGIKWSDMNMENLRLALEITNPQLYEQDKAQIRALIHQYEAATAGIKGDN